MSYFPEDIPFMSKEELRKNGIRIPKDATDKNVGTTDTRQAFMDIVYAELEDDLDNNRANRIIDAADEYAESAQLGTNLAEVGTDTISRQAAIDGLNDAVHEHNITDFDAVATILALPSITPKQRTGKWVMNDHIGTFKIFTCDKCGWNSEAPFNFCPNCGDKKEGESE